MKQILFFLLSLALLIPDCTPVSVDGSGGSEITNGKIAMYGSSSVAGITVAAYPVTFIGKESVSSSIIRTVTDSAGAFELPIDSGKYNIFILDTVSSKGCFLPDIGPYTDLGIVELDSLGSVEGNIHIDTATKLPLTQFDIYARGTPFQTRMFFNGISFSPDSEFTKSNLMLQDDSAFYEGIFRLEHVPAGEYFFTVTFRIMLVGGCKPGEDCGLGTGGGNIGRLENVEVKPGKTADVDLFINDEDFKQVN